MSSPRLRELVNLIMVGVLTAVGFASVYTARQNQISSTSLVYAGFFLALFAVAHIGVRAACRTPTRGSCRSPRFCPRWA